RAADRRVRRIDVRAFAIGVLVAAGPAFQGRAGMSRRLRTVSGIGALILLLSVAAAETVAAAGTVSGPAGAYARLPLVFEKNDGQADAAVTFLACGRGYDVFLTPTEAVLKLAAAGTASPTVLRMTLVAADPRPRM